MIPIALWGEAWPGIRSHFGSGLARPTARTRTSCHGRPLAAHRCREASAGLSPPPAPPPACWERQPMPASRASARCSASLAEHTSTRGVALRCPVVGHMRKAFWERVNGCELCCTRTPTAATLSWHRPAAFRRSTRTAPPAEAPEGQAGQAALCWPAMESLDAQTSLGFFGLQGLRWHCAAQ